jgi:hydrogenase maturation factor
VACNDIATSGAPPRWVVLLVLVPKKEDEQLLDEIMCDISRAAYHPVRTQCVRATSAPG